MPNWNDEDESSDRDEEIYEEEIDSEEEIVEAEALETLKCLLQEQDEYDEEKSEEDEYDQEKNEEEDEKLLLSDD